MTMIAFFLALLYGVICTIKLDSKSFNQHLRLLLTRSNVVSIKLEPVLQSDTTATVESILISPTGAQHKRSCNLACNVQFLPVEQEGQYSLKLIKKRHSNKEDDLTIECEIFINGVSSSKFRIVITEAFFVGKVIILPIFSMSTTEVDMTAEFESFGKNSVKLSVGDIVGQKVPEKPNTFVLKATIKEEELKILRIELSENCRSCLGKLKFKNNICGTGSFLNQQSMLCQISATVSQFKIAQNILRRSFQLNLEQGDFITIITDSLRVNTAHLDFMTSNKAVIESKTILASETSIELKKISAKGSYFLFFWNEAAEEVIEVSIVINQIHQHNLILCLASKETKSHYIIIESHLNLQNTYELRWQDLDQPTQVAILSKNGKSMAEAKGLSPISLKAFLNPGVYVARITCLGDCKAIYELQVHQGVYLCQQKYFKVSTDSSICYQPASNTMQDPNMVVKFKMGQMGRDIIAQLEKGDELSVAVSSSKFGRGVRISFYIGSNFIEKHEYRENSTFALRKRNERTIYKLVVESILSVTVIAELKIIVNKVPQLSHLIAAFSSGEGIVYFGVVFEVADQGNAIIQTKETGQSQFAVVMFDSKGNRFKTISNEKYDGVNLNPGLYILAVDRSKCEADNIITVKIKSKANMKMCSHGYEIDEKLLCTAMLSARTSNKNRTALTITRSYNNIVKLPLNQMDILSIKIKLSDTQKVKVEIKNEDGFVLATEEIEDSQLVTFKSFPFSKYYYIETVNTGNQVLCLETQIFVSFKPALKFIGIYLPDDQNFEEQTAIPILVVATKQVLLSFMVTLAPPSKTKKTKAQTDFTENDPRVQGSVQEQGQTSKTQNSIDLSSKVDISLYGSDIGLIDSMSFTSDAAAMSALVNPGVYALFFHRTTNCDSDCQLYIVYDNEMQICSDGFALVDNLCTDLDFAGYSGDLKEVYYCLTLCVFILIFGAIVEAMNHKSIQRRFCNCFKSDHIPISQEVPATKSHENQSTKTKSLTRSH